MKDKSRIDYLPLGSVVILKGGVQKIVIISRGLVTAATEPAGFFDYGGCVYPQGIIGDHILYFNHKDIVKVVFSGYSDQRYSKTLKSHEIPLFFISNLA